MTVAEVAQAAGLRTPIRHQLFIGGAFVDALNGETLATLNPHDNTPIADVALAGAADVDRAVEAATKALEGASETVFEIGRIETGQRGCTVNGRAGTWGSPHDWTATHNA